MDMIRHHAPRGEAMPLSIEMAQCIGHDGGDFGSPQLAATLSGVEGRLDLRGEKLVESILRGEREGAICATSLREKRDPLTPPLRDDGLRQGIGEAEAHRVGRAGERPVRQTSALADGDVMAEEGLPHEETVARNGWVVNLKMGANGV